MARARSPRPAHCVPRGPSSWSFTHPPIHLPTRTHTHRESESEKEIYMNLTHTHTHTKCPGDTDVIIRMHVQVLFVWTGRRPSYRPSHQSRDCIPIKTAASSLTYRRYYDLTISGKHHEYDSWLRNSSSTLCTKTDFQPVIQNPEFFLRMDLGRKCTQLPTVKEKCRGVQLRLCKQDLAPTKSRPFCSIIRRLQLTQTHHIRVVFITRALRIERDSGIAAEERSQSPHHLWMGQGFV